MTTTTPTTTSATPGTDTLLGEKSEPKVEPKAGPPDKYEFKAPADWADKGWELDPAILEKASPIFKEMGLSQEQAQKLVDFYAAQSATDHQATQDAIKTQSDAWLTELKADPEIGGKLDSVKERVGRMYDAVGNPELVNAFKEQMNLTGIGNHPAFVRFMNAIADKFLEGKHVSGRGPVEVKSPTGQAPSVAQAMYPNLSKG